MHGEIRTSTSAALLPGAQWHRSTHSGAIGNCVEVAALGGDEVAMRNSRDPQGPALVYTRAEIAAFVTGAKEGEFDDFIR